MLAKDNELPPAEGQEAAAEEKPVDAVVIQEMTCEKAVVDTPLPAAGSDLAGTLESPSGETPVEGDVEKAVSKPDGQFKKAEQASQTGFTAVCKETTAEEAVAAKPSPRGTAAAPPNPTEAAAAAPDSGTKTAEGQLKSAAAAIQTAHDRPEVKNAGGSIASIQDTGEEGAGPAEKTALTGEGDFGENDTPDADKLARRIPNRDTATIREDSQVSNPRPLRAETSEMPSGRSMHGGGHVEQETSSGGAGRETPLSTTNEAPSHAAQRPGSTETPFSFATATAAGRGETPAPGTGSAAAMTTKADHFHQDNFHHLVERAVFAMRGEQSEARIALKPDQLGHVQMRIVTENHLVSIKILTESPLVRDLIDANAHQLKSELQQQGLTVEAIEVSVSDDQRDAYRGARQRESFLRQLASQGQRGAQEEGGHPLGRGTGQQRPVRRREAGIDYFA